MKFTKIATAFRDLADAIEELDLAPTQEAGEEKTTKKTTKKKAAKKTTKKATKKTAPKKEEVEDDFEEVEEKDFTEDDVRSAVKAYAKKNSRDAAFELLAEFDANKVADLKKNQYGEVMQRLQ